MGTYSSDNTSCIMHNYTHQRLVCFIVNLKTWKQCSIRMRWFSIYVTFLHYQLLDALALVHTLYIRVQTGVSMGCGTMQAGAGLTL